MLTRFDIAADGYLGRRVSRGKCPCCSPDGGAVFRYCYIKEIYRAARCCLNCGWIKPDKKDESRALLKEYSELQVKHFKGAYPDVVLRMHEIEKQLRAS